MKTKTSEQVKTTSQFKTTDEFKKKWTSKQYLNFLKQAKK